MSPLRLLRGTYGRTQAGSDALRAWRAFIFPALRGETYPAGLLSGLSAPVPSSRSKKSFETPFTNVPFQTVVPCASGILTRSVAETVVAPEVGLVSFP